MECLSSQYDLFFFFGLYFRTGFCPFRSIRPRISPTTHPPSIISNAFISNSFLFIVRCKNTQYHSNTQIFGQKKYAPACCPNVFDIHRPTIKGRRKQKNPTRCRDGAMGAPEGGRAAWCQIKGVTDSPRLIFLSCRLHDVCGLRGHKGHL